MGAPTVIVDAYAIRGGMFYFGAGLTGAYSPAPEPAMVNPAAPVRRSRPERGWQDEVDPPAYDRIGPVARAAYLQWLSDGRRSRAHISNVLLFLYGLERRILVDLAGTLDRVDEYEAVAAEVTELLDWYGDEGSLRRPATEFLRIVQILGRISDPRLHPPAPPEVPTGAMPPELLVGIARYAAARQPLSAAWAFAWHAHDPQRRWGSAANHRPDEFRRAFAEGYAAAYPDGGLLVDAADDLVLSYRPASPGFDGRTVRIHTNLPDVRRSGHHVEALHAIAAHAQQRLSAPAAPSAGYLAAEALLRLAAVVANSGGTISDAKAELLRRHITDALELTDAERSQLDARLTQLVRQPPNLDAVRQRFSRLPAEQQSAAADLLIALAGVDGTLEPMDVQVLSDVFGLLGLDPAQLRRRLHELEDAAAAPANPTSANEETIVLDLMLTSRKIVESADVAALLTDRLRLR